MPETAINPFEWQQIQPRPSHGQTMHPRDLTVIENAFELEQARAISKSTHG
jgi:hypothetical protein